MSEDTYYAFILGLTALMPILLYLELLPQSQNMDRVTHSTKRKQEIQTGIVQTDSDCS